MKSWLALAAAAAVLAPQAASAADADVRCIVLMDAVARNKQAPAQQAQFAASAMIYYIGKADGRGLGPKLKDLAAAEAKTLTPATAQPEANRCAQQFQARGNQLGNVPSPAAAAKGAAPASKAAPAKAPAAK